MRARDLGLACGKLPPGEHNSIADVPGVTVGHTTVVEGDVRTGVTFCRTEAICSATKSWRPGSC
jgi:L-aminopeptidase/D-esterase-like protein